MPSREERDMDEIREVIENALALAGYDIVDSNGNIVWIHDKEEDLHYSIKISE